MSLVKRFFSYAHSWYNPTPAAGPDGPPIKYEIQPVVLLENWTRGEPGPLLHQVSLLTNTVPNFSAAVAIQLQAALPVRILSLRGYAGDTERQEVPISALLLREEYTAEQSALPNNQSDWGPAQEPALTTTIVSINPAAQIGHPWPWPDLPVIQVEDRETLLVTNPSVVQTNFELFVLAETLPAAIGQQVRSINRRMYD